MQKKNNPNNSQLFLGEVDDLLVLCAEVMRATPQGANRFIEPAPGVLARAKSKQHHIIFGRRGSGKSSLLRKMAADLTIDRRPIAFVDMETFKGHTYPDVLISVLLKSLNEFSSWLQDAATTPANRTSFWLKLFGAKPSRRPFDKKNTQAVKQRLDKLIADLEAQLSQPEQAQKSDKITTHHEDSQESEAGLKIESTAIDINARVTANERKSKTHEQQSTYVSHKVEYLHQNILRFQSFFGELSKLSEGPSFLVLDDLYHIRRADQAKVIDYFHRVAKGSGLWLKIGTIKHRSEWYQHSDPPIGVKLGDDVIEINLDSSLEMFDTLKIFLRKILENLIAEKPPLVMKELINNAAVDRLVIASGGVARDFVGIFSKAVEQARNRGPDDHRGSKVGVEDVNRASGDYDPNKREEFKLDAADDREALEKAFEAIAQFCTERAKCNIFLVPQKLVGNVRNAVDQLIDLRLIHLVKSRVTMKSGRAGELFEAYMLDLSQYTAARKVHDFHLVDLSAADKDEQMRRASLIYKSMDT